MEIYEYTPKGVCATKMIFEIEDNKVLDLKVTNGCPGPYRCHNFLQLLLGDYLD